ncbi:hypothetical protein J4456_01430 [Candidatus Pacearchaeota archaeon]|nr:hypothetical protein [Candidatus Pacearchaeota archaeon]
MQTKTQYKFISPEEQSRFKESINQFSGKAYDSLNIPKDGSLNGSNVWKVLWLNQTGIRTATIPEIYSATDNGSNGDLFSNNNYLAQKLAEDLHLTNFDNPYIVKGLKIKEDEKSVYGLSFLVDTAEVIEAKDFHYKNNRKKFTRINEDYSIEFNDEGTRTLYTRKDGLSRLFVSGVCGLSSNDFHLAYSYDLGRVVVVSDAEGAAPNFCEGNLINAERAGIREAQKIPAEEKNIVNPTLEQVLVIGTKYVSEAYREAYNSEIKKLYE